MTADNPTPAQDAVGDEREALAAVLIDYQHPSINALTKPDDALVMVRTDPNFFVCRDALALADAILAAGYTRTLAEQTAGVTVTEWGVRTHTEGARPNDQREPTEAVARAAAIARTSHLTSNPKFRGTFNGRPFVRCEVITRQRTTYADHVTDWQPADTEGGDDA